MTNSCGNCKFFKPGKVIGGPGACRRNPPMPLLMPTATGNLVIQGSFAPVGPSDWCGEHTSNEQAIPSDMIQTDRDGRPHDWKRTAFGETCSRCYLTRAEVKALGNLDECDV